MATITVRISAATIDLEVTAEYDFPDDFNADDVSEFGIDLRGHALRAIGAVEAGLADSLGDTDDAAVDDDLPAGV